MNKTKEYKIDVSFISNGTVTVKAKNKKEAKEIVQENLWATLEHVGINDDTNIVDWDISLHCDTKIGKVHN